MRVVVVGVGYVGLTTGAALAALGFRVTGLDTDAERIALLRRGVLPFYELGLKEIVDANIAAGRLSFTTDYTEACRDADVVFIAVNTPTGAVGEARLTAVFEVTRALVEVLPEHAIIVIKSTVPPGTNALVQQEFSRHHGKGRHPVVVSNPEFLREGQAILDTFLPDRIVIGARDDEGVAQLQELYAAIVDGSATVPGLTRPAELGVRPVPVVITTPETAELTKYAANTFLATKISFINEIANVAEAFGADITVVAEAMGYDRRIGRQFLNAGLGFGGSCFPKDLRALLHVGQERGVPMQILDAVLDVNTAQRARFVQRIVKDWPADETEITLAIFGLSFKPGTDDIREAPAFDIMRALHDYGVRLRATDPQAIPRAEKAFPEARYFEDPMEAAKDVDGIVVCTEWPIYRDLDWRTLARKVRRAVVFDGRNCLPCSALTEAGWTYYGVGRPDIKATASNPL